MGATSIGCAHVLVEVTGRGALARVFLLLQRWYREAHGETSEHSQNVRGFGRAHPALVFIEHFVEPIVQGTLDAPVGALCCLQAACGEDSPATRC